MNLAYYVPFGAATAMLGWHPVLIGGVAGLLSGTTEVVQIFSTDRTPSITDLVLNVGGAVVGLAIISFVRDRIKSSA